MIPAPNRPRATTAGRVEVVAAVIQRGDGRFLLAQRPPGKVYAGYWEFPGGKVEPGESPAGAIGRELAEELGITVEQTWPWITRDYDYAHAAVRLRFHRVTRWRGELHGRESQQFAWQSIDAITVSPLLPANGPVLRALALPARLGITHAEAGPADAFLDRVRGALARGLKFIQVREPALTADARAEFALRVLELARETGARVTLNDDPAVAERIGAHGVHLSSTRLLRLHERPALDLVGASCHDATELQHAIRLGLDYIVLGPVRPTPSHPGAPVLGWDRFAALIAGCPLPVYALGGLQPEDETRAWAAGAHGIAMMRGAWLD